MGAEASQMLPYLRGGTIKVFAMLSSKRWAAAPEIPTIEEVGVPDLVLSFWQAFWVPKATPHDIVAKLNGAAVAALADASVRHHLDELGQEIPTSEQQTPESLGAYHRAEIEKWWPIIKAAAIKPD
jgi:tripartite-type tricarboxylate transporter receptor subunit TctC